MGHDSGPAPAKQSGQLTAESGSTYLPLLLGAAFTLAFAPLGMIQFGGSDFSALILSGWYMHTGLVPYRDVPYTLPPLFYLGAGWAFRLFGAHWWAFVAMTTTFAVVTYVWLFSHLRTAGFPIQLAAAIACVTEIATIMTGAFWWYNTITSLVVVVFFANTLACLAKPQSRSAWVGTSVSLALLLLAKPNSWPAGICMVVLLASRTAAARVRALITGAAGLALAALLCCVHGFTPFDVLRWYAKIAATRGSPFTLESAPDMRVNIVALALAGVTVLLALANTAEWREHWREYVCCLGIALSSAWMYLTNFELKTSDAMPLAVAAIALAYRPWSSRRFTVPRRVFAIAALATIAVISFTWAVTRERIRTIGEMTFYETPLQHRFDGGFFAGLRTGARFPLVVQQMGDALDRHPGCVFFGPRMEFGYAAFNRPAGRGLPVFWFLGTSYAMDDVPAILDAFRNDDFQTLIFLKNDFTRVHPQLLLNIRQQYRRIDDEYSELTVFVRKPASSSYAQ